MKNHHLIVFKTISEATFFINFDCKTNTKSLY